MKTKGLITIVFVLFAIALLYLYVFKDLIGEIKYGKSANEIRKRVKVPVIEPNMRKHPSIRGVDGGKWESKDTSGDFVHLWKIVTPGSIYKLDRDSDLFKKNDRKGDYWHLNVYSQIIKDSVSVRKGSLRFYQEQKLAGQRELDDKGLDSLFRKWNILSLVRE